MVQEIANMLSRNSSTPLLKTFFNFNPLQHNFLRRIYHVAPDSEIIDSDVPHDFQMDTMDDELFDSDWIGIDDKECTDEQLMDDARPGRRKGKEDQDFRLQSIVKQLKRLMIYYCRQFQQIADL
ncbi:Nn.00g061920.m01.CDS01 [Neocucurbitaria sp. VM-36]